jgi:NADH:quinone reductase (non-electrogenic)
VHGPPQNPNPVAASTTGVVFDEASNDRGVARGGTRRMGRERWRFPAQRTLKSETIPDMVSAYITVGLVCGGAFSYVVILHHFWLRHVFNEASTSTSPAGSALTSPDLNRKQIIILGGGFAGVKCAQTLSRALSRNDTEIVLFNAENHFVFTPLLADVIGASVNPLDVVVPLRQLLSGVHCRTEEVVNLDAARNEVEYRSSDGQTCRLHYDHLVLACGNVANLHAVPGMADHAFPLKNIGDAVALRSHVMEQMEKAETCADPERRQWFLSFIIVGAGYSGVEAAGEINDLVRGSARYFQNFRAEDVTVTLIHSRDQILPEIGQRLREFARRKMERAGVKILLNARVASATAEGVALAGGEFVSGGTVVCTVGSSPAPILGHLAAPKVKGRLLTEPDMRVRDGTNIWATGDCAQIVNAHDGQPSPPTGQFAERQGRQCAQNIVRALRSEPTRSFSFKPVGQLCSIGGHSAVAVFQGMQISGILAWFLWRSVYLFKLPAWTRRIQVGFDWAWQLVFPRDLAHLRTRQTDRVSHAHYQPGDLIIRQGEASASFYVIESGEVEIVCATENSSRAEVVNILGPQSFFGEDALLGKESVNLSVRARTVVKVLVMGRNVFTQVSGALAPLRDALAETLNRRSIDLRQLRPEAHEALKGVAIRELMDAVPSPLFKPTSTMREVGRAFAEHNHELFYICGEGQALEGVVTMTDWMRALSRGAGPDTPVTELMVRHPITLSIEEDGAMAATVIREHRVKNLPVVKCRGNRQLVGCLRTRRLMAHVFNGIKPHERTNH